jgi:hypothetical protein
MGEGDLGDGKEYKEYGEDWPDCSMLSCVSDRAWFIDPDSGNSLVIGGLEGNAASRRGVNIVWATLGLEGMGMGMLRLLWGASMMLPLLVSKGMFRLWNASLLSRAGSIVSRECSRTDAWSVWNCCGMVFGEHGGELSERYCSRVMVRSDRADDSSGMVEKDEERFLLGFTDGVWKTRFGRSGSYSSVVSDLLDDV